MQRAKTSPRWQALLGDAAEFCGTAINRIGAASSDLAGLGGAGLVSFGLGQIYGPLLPIAAGTFLLMIGRHLR